jgi:hypothetical protein
LESRKNGVFNNQVYADYSATQGYALVSYYLNAFINGGEGRTLNDVDYTSVDEATILKVAEFLKTCQQDQSFFDYTSNQCLNFPNTPFFETNFATTVGYSENLYNF